MPPSCSPAAAGRISTCPALLYIGAWLAGNGAVGIHNLTEDAATAEIARSQIWQWLHKDVVLEDGRALPREFVGQVVDETLGKFRGGTSAEAFAAGRYEHAREVFAAVALAENFPDFLTVPAYDLID